MTDEEAIAAVIITELRRQDNGDYLSPYFEKEYDGNWTVDGVVNINAIAAAITAAGYRKAGE
jgi:hypothetical protein